MPEPKLHITNDGEVTVVTFASATILDIATSQSLSRQLLRLADSPPAPKILIDFDAVRFIASRMLGLLLELSRRAEGGKGKIVICALHGEVRDVFATTRLDRMLTVAADKRQGLDILAARGEG